MLKFLGVVVLPLALGTIVWWDHGLSDLSVEQATLGEVVPHILPTLVLQISESVSPEIVQNDEPRIKMSGRDVIRAKVASRRIAKAYEQFAPQILEWVETAKTAITMTTFVESGAVTAQ